MFTDLGITVKQVIQAHEPIWNPHSGLFNEINLLHLVETKKAYVLQLIVVTLCMLTIQSEISKIKWCCNYLV
jgi:hypothetical protein